jgi:predicted NUDIX family NTP pyrophosphohydrolase
MVVRRSAGVLLFRHPDQIEVLLGHMGGPFWARKDDRAWSIPKGEYESDEDPFAAARREFEEELGSPPPSNGYLELGEVSQPGGKVVTIWAVAGEFDVATAISNTFELEWPRGSGRVMAFPEIDRAAWFDIATASIKLVKGQVPFLDRLITALAPDVGSMS